VQSSIAFTSIGPRQRRRRGRARPAASNLLWHLHHAGAGEPADAHARRAPRGGWKSVQDIVVQLLLPFIAGQLARPLVAKWIEKNKQLIGYVDRGSILLVVYAAFSEAVVGGIWHKISPAQLGLLLAVCGALLAVVLTITTYGARTLGFSPEDEKAITFCGSKKSLATGVPMAGILFPGPTAGIIVLPLMIFHQIQLMACSVIAQHYGARNTPNEA
jgi:sodium/bile acid cotransporter 7